MLACDCQRLPISLPVVKQMTLVALYRSSRNLGWGGDAFSSAPGQKHLHVNPANSEGTFGETFHGKVLKVFIEKSSEWLRAEWFHFPLRLRGTPVLSG